MRESNTPAKDKCLIYAVTIILFTPFVPAFPDAAADLFGKLRAWLIATFDWVFQGVAIIVCGSSLRAC